MLLTFYLKIIPVEDPIKKAQNEINDAGGQSKKEGMALQRNMTVMGGISLVVGKLLVL